MLHKKSDRLCFLTVAQQVTFLKLLRQRLKHVLNPKILPKIIIRANKTQHYPSRSLLLRRFVFRMAERVSAKRVTGDEPQGTMGRLRTAGEAPSPPLSPSRLPLRAHFNQKRNVWVRGRSKPLVSIWTALKPVCLATAPVIRTSLLTIFTAWALTNQSIFDRVINSHHKGEFLGNLQCCNSFTGKKIVSYIKAEDGPVFTVYSEVRYVAKHCNRLKLTRYSYTVRVIFPYSHIQII